MTDDTEEPKKASVVSLIPNTEAPTTTPKLDPQLIAYLEDLVQSAKEGKLRHMAAIEYYTGGYTNQSLMGMVPTTVMSNCGILLRDLSEQYMAMTTAYLLGEDPYEE